MKSWRSLEKELMRLSSRERAGKDYANKLIILFNFILYV